MTVDPPNEHGETWFGSGLRAHLGIQPSEEPAPSEPNVDPEPSAPEPARVVARPAEDPDAAERERRIRQAELELAERERKLAEEGARIEQVLAEVETRAAEIARAERQLPVRDVLRDRAEREADRLWRTIDEALEATFEDGKPDFHARLAAIKLLLGEAYDDDSTAAEALPPRELQPEDELAVRRAERLQL